MAPPTNWLSFSLSPMEMLSSTNSHFLHYDDPPSSADTSPPPPLYFLDNNFFPNGWTHPKSEVVLNNTTEMEQNNQNRETHQAQHNMMMMMMMGENSNNNFLSSLNRNQPPLAVPKLEDFFETETPQQDSSSLTQLYFNDQQDLKAIAGFEAFSNTNSGSEVVDDSASKTRAVSGGSNSVESSAGGGSNNSKGALSLGVVAVAEDSDKAAIVVADSDASKKVVDTFGQRTSIYRGVTRHRWTGRYEAHLWDNSCRREGQARKGRQVYLGGYDKEEKAARAYDLAALKYWGPTATTNFPVSNYTQELEQMRNAGKQEFIASLRRKSSGFSRGASIYRGVTRHHQQGRWQARIGRVAGNKDLYLGTFTTEEEAAEAYDIAAIKFRGLNAVTNFEMSRYDVEAILNNSLPVGGTAKRLKLSLESEKEAPISSTDAPHQQPQSTNDASSSTVGISTIQPVAPTPTTQFNPATAFYNHNHFHQFHPTNTVVADGPAKSVPAANAAALSDVPAAPEFYIWPHQSY